MTAGIDDIFDEELAELIAEWEENGGIGEKPTMERLLKEKIAFASRNTTSALPNFTGWVCKELVLGIGENTLQECNHGSAMV